MSCCGSLCCVGPPWLPVLCWEAPATALYPVGLGWRQLSLTGTSTKLDCYSFKEVCLLLGWLQGWWQPGEPEDTCGDPVQLGKISLFH